MIGTLGSRAAAFFASAGRLDDARPLLEPLGWQGDVGAIDDSTTIGRLYESSINEETRRRLGIHFTPGSVAEGLTAVTLVDAPPDASVCDPSCGAGAFLIAAADRLHRNGASVERVITGQLFGVDVDGAAIAVARLSLALWGFERSGAVHVVPEGHLIVGDGLIEAPGPGRFDVIVGNPPFGSQLRGVTVRDADRRRQIEGAIGLGALRYADEAGLFLVRACDLAAPGATVSLVLPRSILAARDAEPIRRAVQARALLKGVWTGGDDVGFDAAVQVWAPILRRCDGNPDEPRAVDRFVGPSVDAHDRVTRVVDPATWAPLVADLVGGIDGNLDACATDGILGDVATFTAGFRRHFYGLIPHVTDASDENGPEARPKLVTTGAIDPFHLRWDDTPVRFGGRNHRRPVVNVHSLRVDQPALADWVEGRLIPKVLVASQGRVIEAVLDLDGRLVPSTPVVSVEPAVGAGVTASHLAALVSSPVASAWMQQRAAGSGLGSGRFRVSASLLADLPLPEDRAAWDDGAEHAVRATDLADRCDVPGWCAARRDGARSMLRAYGLPGDDPLLEWWERSSPEWRDARPWTT